MVERFKSAGHFAEPLSAGYRLLPFRFDRVEGNTYLLTNQVGNFLELDRPTLDDFARHRLSHTAPTYAELKSKHFLMDDDSAIATDLLALKLRTKLHRLADFTGLHMFVVSLRCEHSCGYCQVSRRGADAKAYDMTVETAERALDLVFRSPTPSPKIEFQGGEPLLNFPLVRHVVESAEKRNAVEKRSLQFVIATNLALVTDEILEFCRAYDVLISTSLDGPRDLHNKNRPRPGGDSYERAIDGITWARAVLGKDRVGALMTATQASLDRVRDIIDEYVVHDFPGIFLRTLSPYGFAIKTKWHAAYDVEHWLKFYFEGLDYIIELNKAGIPFTEYYASAILTKMLTPFDTTFVDLMSPAGIGIAAVVYNYDGDVYASDEARMLAEMGDKSFRIGNVHTDTYDDIFTSDALLAPLEESYTGSAPMCSECAFEPFCGADPVFHHATQGDALGKKPLSAFCRRNMAMIKGLIIRMRDEETKRIFLQWVN